MKLGDYDKSTILKGRDAKKFFQKMREAEEARSKWDKKVFEEMQRVRANYEKLMAITIVGDITQ